MNLPTLFRKEREKGWGNLGLSVSGERVGQPPAQRRRCAPESGDRERSGGVSKAFVWGGRPFDKLRAGSRPPSDDLRQKLLEAYDHGKGSLVELAERFGVSLGWAWKISSARKRTGRIERASYRPGPKPRVDEQVLAGLLRGHA